MRDLGLVRLSAESGMPGMAMHPATTTVPPTDGNHEIRRVVDTDGVADHVRAAAEGFGLPETVVAAIVNAETVGATDVAVYVGYTDGEPVSSGLGVRTGRTIGVYNIATVERARRRGYGAAMTARVVAEGAAAGCDVAILQASPMGLPIYERLGSGRSSTTSGGSSPRRYRRPATRADGAPVRAADQPAAEAGAAVIADQQGGGPC